LFEGRTILTVALLIALAITGIGWAAAEFRPRNMETLPVGLKDWTEYFRGYQAYLDRRIFFSVVRTTSMLPTIGENDLVLWVKVDPGELRVGDIIIFQHPTLPDVDNVVHRIVEIQFDGSRYTFRTKGDNSSSPDRYYVPETNVHGLVIGVVYRDSLK